MKPSRSHAQRKRACCSEEKHVFPKGAHVYWLAIETVDNMATLKCRLQCMDYNCLEGHLTVILPSFVILINFYGSKKL